jgi:hypothetical protein
MERNYLCHAEKRCGVDSIQASADSEHVLLLPLSDYPTLFRTAFTSDPMAVPSDGSVLYDSLCFPLSLSLR